MRHRPYEVGVLARQADGESPVNVDRRDDLAVDLSDEHHPRDLERLGVGHRQPVPELRLFAETLHELSDLRAAAVYDHRQHTDRTQQHDVLGERSEGVGNAPAHGETVRRGDRVPAVLDDDDRTGKRLM